MIPLKPVLPARPGHLRKRNIKHAKVEQEAFQGELRA